VLILGVITLQVISSVLKHNGDDSYSAPVPTSTDSPTYEPSETPSGGTTTEPTTTAPTTTRTTTKPTAPRTTTRPTTRPTTNPGPSDSDLVLRSKLYKVGAMGSVNCRESKSRPATASGARANYKNLLACLNRAWAPLVTKAGGRFKGPNVVTFSGNFTSPCGIGGSANGPPFYCGGTRTIYMNLNEDMGNYNRYPQAYQKVWARMWMLHQFAHEYGHHVQALTGILQASANLQYEAQTQADELDVTRRKELQASCFSDIFIGSNRRTYPITGEALFQWKWLIGHVTDDGNDHGDAVNHQYWATRGYNGRNPSVCNTYASSAARTQ
jgi:predicted metalloprotease